MLPVVDSLHPWYYGLDKFIAALATPKLLR